jgi:putative membrane protein insertion efficiency factor
MKRIITRAIRAYQAVSRSVTAAPLLPGAFSGCRSWPTCSDYAVEVIGREGVLKGGAKAVLRIARCNPFWPPRHHD